MRLAHIITRFLRAGAEENTLLSCNGQAALGHDVLLIHGRESSPPMLERLDPRVQVARAPHLVRNLSPLDEPRAVLEMVRILKDFRADIVHTHTSKAGILGRAAAKLARTRGIVHGVHIAPFLNVGRAEEMVYLAAERMLASATDMFVNVSEGMRRACLDNYVGEPERHVVIASGMDVDAFRKAQPLARDELARRLGVAPEGIEGAKFVLVVAALEPRKRQVPLLDVFAAVRAARPEAQLILLGEGAEYQALAARIGQLGLEGAVHLAGFQDDAERWVATADVCALTSEREGLPRVVIQYAIAGKPVVVTAVPGVEAVVRHGETGFIIPLDDLGAACAPLVTLLSDDELRGRMQTAARKLDFSAWDADVMVRELETVYARVMAEKG